MRQFLTFSIFLPFVTSKQPRETWKIRFYPSLKAVPRGDVFLSSFFFFCSFLHPHIPNRTLKGGSMLSRLDDARVSREPKNPQAIGSRISDLVVITTLTRRECLKSDVILRAHTKTNERTDRLGRLLHFYIFSFFPHLSCGLICTRRRVRFFSLFSFFWDFTQSLVLLN